MKKTILLTGSTDGIGLETARLLVSDGHHVLLHGRSPKKLAAAATMLSAIPGGGTTTSYIADFSSMSDVESMAKALTADHRKLDVLINNAGVLTAANSVTPDGLDLRFVVNTFAPYLLTQRLLPLLGRSARVLNLSSAAQSPVNLSALAGQVKLTDYEAYAQSKLALTMWSRFLAFSGHDGPVVIAVNPGSMLGTKMVKEAFGQVGGDVGIGAIILRRLAMEDEFSSASGLYFDNDAGKIALPHPDALDPQKSAAVVSAIEAAIVHLT